MLVPQPVNLDPYFMPFLIFSISSSLTFDKIANSSPLTKDFGKIPSLLKLAIQ